MDRRAWGLFPECGALAVRAYGSTGSVWRGVVYLQYFKGKFVPTLRCCILVTDGIKINEQEKLIVIGPLYLQTKFEVI